MNVEIKKVRLVHAEPTTLQRILQKDPRSRVCRHIRLLTLYLISFPEPTIENMCSGLLSFSSSVSLAVYFSHGTNRSRMDRTKSIHQSITRLERTLEAQGTGHSIASLAEHTNLLPLAVSTYVHVPPLISRAAVSSPP